VRKIIPTLVALCICTFSGQSAFGEDEKPTVPPGAETEQPPPPPPKTTGEQEDFVDENGFPAAEPGPTDSTTPAAEAPATPPAASGTPKATPEQLKKRNEFFGKASKLMAQKKFDEAIKAFDGAWKSGGDEGESLIYMGSCYYSKKQYPLALKQYQLAASKGATFKIRNKADGMASRLASYMRGVCPDTCLKASSPGWVHRDVAGNPSKSLWMHFHYSDGKGSGTVAYSQAHIGEKIGRVNGIPKSIGKCPTCGGSGRVSLP